MTRNPIEVDTENVLAFIATKPRPTLAILRHCRLSGKRWRAVRLVLLAAGVVEKRSAGGIFNKEDCIGCAELVSDVNQF